MSKTTLGFSLVSLVFLGQEEKSTSFVMVRNRILSCSLIISQIGHPVCAGALWSALCCKFFPDHNLCMRKNVWGFISLICKTKQLDSLSVANIQWSRLFRRWLGIYVKIKIVYTLWPTNSTSEYLSPKDMSPKKQYLTVIWGPLNMCLLKNVFVNQNFGHNWLKQLLFTKGLLRSFNMPYMLWDAQWMGLFDFEFPWDKILWESDLDILLELEWRHEKAHFLGFWLAWWQWALIMPSTTVYKKLSCMKIGMTKALSSGNRRRRMVTKIRCFYLTVFPQSCCSYDCKVLELPSV